MTLSPLPERPGAYRWFYADVAAGDLTAVLIFMVGSVFSARYSTAWRRGGLPAEHCAVNLAVYQKGVRRVWILSEYSGLAASERELTIGQSWLRVGASGRMEATLVDRTTPWGRPVTAHLTLEPLVPPLNERRLISGAPHFWQPLAASARARLELPSHGLVVEGPAYFDTNHGDELLGGSVAGWTWLRRHEATGSRVGFWPHGLNGESQPLWVEADGAGVRWGERAPMARWPTARTGWRLEVPSSLGRGPTALRPYLLESSPFYARLEAREAEAHTLAEVADFSRFHRPAVRWMARFRSRRVREKR